MGRYKQLSEDVLIMDSKSCSHYFSRVASAEGFNRKLYDEEAEYQVSFSNIGVEMMKDEYSADAVLITFCREDKESVEKKCCFVDVIMSNVLGMFISDWY